MHMTKLKFFFLKTLCDGTLTLRAFSVLDIL